MLAAQVVAGEDPIVVDFLIRPPLCTDRQCLAADRLRHRRIRINLRRHTDNLDIPIEGLNGHLVHRCFLDIAELNKLAAAQIVADEVPLGVIDLRKVCPGCGIVQRPAADRFCHRHIAYTL